MFARKEVPIQDRAINGKLCSFTIRPHRDVKSSRTADAMDPEIDSVHSLNANRFVVRVMMKSPPCPPQQTIKVCHLVHLARLKTRSEICLDLFISASKL